jgi:hypothetical protein
MTKDRAKNATALGFFLPACLSQSITLACCSVLLGQSLLVWLLLGALLVGHNCNPRPFAQAFFGGDFNPRAAQKTDVHYSHTQ